jgi:hypothetical protein
MRTTTRLAALLVFLACSWAGAYQTWNAMTLGADSVLQGDSTYYLSGNVTLGARNITSNATAAHHATVKTDGTHQFQLNGAGSFVVSYVDFTSRNNDTLGSAIPGSSHTPATGDQTPGYVLRVTGAISTSVISIDHALVSYATVTASPVLGGNTNSVAAFTLTNSELQKCTVNATAAYCGLLGYNVSAYGGSFTLRNVKIGPTNTVGNTSYGMAVCAYATYGNVIIDGLYLAFAGSGTNGLWLTSTLPTSTDSIKNSIIVGGTAVADNRGLVAVRDQASITATWTIINNTISNTSTGHGLYFDRLLGGTLVAAVANNIIYGCAGASAKGLNRYTATGTTITHTYNDYSGNTANAYEALGATEITTNPALGNLPTGVVIDAANCPFPNGYAAGLAIQKTGSNTFTALGIDTTVSTGTGYKYSGSDTITPGIDYTVTGFAPSAPVASSVTISGSAHKDSTLTGHYTWSSIVGHTEGTSTFRWLRNGVAITGATASTYTLVDADGNRSIVFEVTPVAATGVSPGSAVQSLPTSTSWVTRAINAILNGLHHIGAWIGIGL